MAEGRLYWLMKSEPDVFSIDDLQKQIRTAWEGVRNYQARNFMRDQMQVGDRVLYYHSSGEPSGVAGLARVTAAGFPDPSQFQPRGEYFDPKSKKEAPTWVCVEIEFVAKFPPIVQAPWLDGSGA